MCIDSNDNDALVREAVTAGIRHIGIAVYSSGKVLKYLQNKGYSYPIASEAVKVIVSRGYIDDIRAGKKVVNSRVGRKQESKRLIYQRLINDGVSKDAANCIVSDLSDDKDTCLLLFDALLSTGLDFTDDTVFSFILKKAIQRGYSSEIASISLRRWISENSVS